MRAYFCIEFRFLGLCKMEKSHKFDELGNLILYSFLNYIDESAKSNINHVIETFD